MIIDDSMIGDFLILAIHKPIMKCTNEQAFTVIEFCNHMLKIENGMYCLFLYIGLIKFIA